MENIVKNTKTMMGDRRDGCDCAHFDVGGGELKVRKGIVGFYIRCHGCHSHS